ncbi:MAG: TIGR01458 family HAD-type hydrolase [Alphaproteobacteria bacterium]|nr:TIGR01458 family HAD-type hydrolase [Alphaproteobacteria bacterium]MBU0831435.1 TIGR01458 family HAD-type hydrolase [Alphaproteobacteria bacterium]MBU1764328.1 TIGR01458 family HAD-type hydrolase [Alphaproteobacteria bacterium]
MSVSVRAILCDIDGTLMFGGSAIPGAVEAISELRAAGIALRFLTNISSLAPDALAARLSQHGFDIQAEEIETSVTACASLLARDVDRTVWLLVPDSVRHLFDQCSQTTRNPDTVVVTDVRHGFSYAAMNEAYLMLSQGADFVVPHRTMYSVDERGRYLDAGAFIAGLEAAIGRKATVTGKPSATFFNEALRTVGWGAGDVLVVGDDMLTDIRGAEHCGMRSVLVATGKGTTPYNSASAGQPTFLLSTIASLPALVHSLNRKTHHAADLTA